MIIDYRCQIMSGIRRYTTLGHFSTWALNLLGKTDKFNIFIGLLISTKALGKSFSLYSFLKSQELNLLFSYAISSLSIPSPQTPSSPLLMPWRKRVNLFVFFSDLVSTGCQQKSIITTNICCAVILCKVLCWILKMHYCFLIHVKILWVE